MKKLLRWAWAGSLAACAFALVAPAPVLAQDSGKVEQVDRLRGRIEGFSFIGNAGGEFLTIPVGARGVAMGQAFTAVVDDISALWWNPAGLGFMRQPAALFTNVNMPLDVQINYVGAAAPVLGGNGVVAGSFELLSMDDQPITTIVQPAGTGEEFSPWSSAAQFSYAHNISDRFAAGGSFKWVHENVADVTSDAFQFDFGTNYHTTFMGRGIRLAFVVQNLGTNFQSEGGRLDVQFDPRRIPEAEQLPDFPTFPQSGALDFQLNTREFRPPTTLKTALAYFLVENESSTFIVNGEFAAPRQLETTYSVGGEWTQVLVQPTDGGVATTFSARAGYTYQQDEENLEDSPNDNDIFRGVGFGGGLQFDFAAFGSSFDYAFRDWGRLGGTNNFSVSVLF